MQGALSGPPTLVDRRCLVEGISNHRDTTCEDVQRWNKHRYFVEIGQSEQRHTEECNDQYAENEWDCVAPWRTTGDLRSHFCSTRRRSSRHTFDVHIPCFRFAGAVLQDVILNDIANLWIPVDIAEIPKPGCTRIQAAQRLMARTSVSSAFSLAPTSAAPWPGSLCTSRSTTVAFSISKPSRRTQRSCAVSNTSCICGPP